MKSRYNNPRMPEQAEVQVGVEEGFEQTLPWSILHDFRSQPLPLLPAKSFKQLCSNSRMSWDNQTLQSRLSWDDIMVDVTSNPLDSLLPALGELILSGDSPGGNAVDIKVLNTGTNVVKEISMVC